jgi:predicted metal-dependent phosphoesterase TrpH
VSGVAPPAGGNGWVDLHTHTTASDGLLTPTQLVEHAAAAGLRAIAVTDHDTTAGLAEAIAAGRERGIEVVPGVEISTSHAGLEVHLLGYFVEVGSADFERLLASRREDRDGRAREMVDRLREQGVRIEYEDVLREAGRGAVGRPHVAAALVTKGWVRTKQEAFDRWLADGRSCAVPKPVFPLAEAIALLQGMGAVPVCAHPGLLKRRELLEEMPAMGLLGVEVYYPKHQPEQQRELLDFARARGLVATGGSDFHSPTQPGPLGTHRIPAAVLEELRGRRGSPSA